MPVKAKGHPCHDTAEAASVHSALLGSWVEGKCSCGGSGALGSPAEAGSKQKPVKSDKQDEQKSRM